MEDLLEFMLFATPIAVIVGGTIYAARRKIANLRIALATEAGANRTAQIATEKSALEERVRVLERIVTSRGYSVSEEIEALRDAPLRVENDTADTGVPLTFANKERA